MGTRFRTSIDVAASPERVFEYFVRPELLVRWMGNDAMPPGSTKLTVRLEPHEGGTRVHLEHDGLEPGEAKKHALGWPHFLERLAVAAAGGDPGVDPWKAAPPV